MVDEKLAEMKTLFENMKQIFDSMEPNQKNLFLKSLIEEIEENETIGKEYNNYIESQIRDYQF